MPDRRQDRTCPVAIECKNIQTITYFKDVIFVFFYFEKVPFANDLIVICILDAVVQRAPVVWINSKVKNPFD